MNSTEQLEKVVLGLPAADRAQLALIAWESLEDESAFWADAQVDAEGVALAQKRSTELADGAVKALSHEEFLRLTSSS